MWLSSSKQEAVADPVARAARDNEGWQGGGITSCLVLWRWEAVADPAAGGGTIILRRLLEVRKPVLFPSIYLDSQDVKDTCPLGTVSTLVG